MRGGKHHIEKRPKLRGKQGMYAVVGMNGQTLRRGHDLAAVLRVLEAAYLRFLKVRPRLQRFFA
mgnify:CR=1 FL=1